MQWQKTEQNFLETRAPPSPPLSQDLDLFFKMGHIGSGLGLMSFHKMSPRTHHNYLYQNHWLHRLIYCRKNVVVPSQHYLNTERQTKSGFILNLGI